MLNEQSLGCQEIVHHTSKRRQDCKLWQVHKTEHQDLISSYVFFTVLPGGSGKATVIDLVVKYAAEYCGYIENFEFTPRTILVTAMTGVAATILLGETTHAAVYLNQKCLLLEAEQIKVWKETRLLIIDEILFASKEDFCQLHKKFGG